MRLIRPSADVARPRREQAAFTLIEILMALGIAVMVVALVFSVYHVVTMTVGATVSAGRNRREAVLALNAIRRDVACSVRLQSPEEPPFRLRAGGGTKGDCSLVDLCTIWVGREAVDLQGCSVRRVTYQIELSPNDPTDGNVLTRTVREFDQQGIPGPAVADELVQCVFEFHVVAFDGSGWHSTWPIDDERPLPSAARITLVCGDQGSSEKYEVEVLIRVDSSL